MLAIEILSKACEITYRWMPQHLFGGQTALV